MSEFIKRVLSGERPDAAQVREYYIDFHATRPSATSSAMEMLRTKDGRTSYELLADRARSCDPSTVLDVGCGDGALLGVVAKRIGGATLTGIDLAETDLDTARRAFPEMTFVRADADALPFAAASFDLTLSHMVLMLLPDVVPALREIRRVTRPGHKLLATVSAPEHGEQRIATLYRFIHERIRAVYKNYAPINPGDERMWSRGGIQEAFKAAGYEGEPHFDETAVAAELNADEVWQVLLQRYYFGSLPKDVEDSIRGDIRNWLDDKPLGFSESLRIVEIST